MDYNEWLANWWITEMAPLTAQELWYWLSSISGQVSIYFGFGEEILNYFFQDTIQGWSVAARTWYDASIKKPVEDSVTTPVTTYFTTAGAAWFGNLIADFFKFFDTQFQFGFKYFAGEVEKEGRLLEKDL